MAEPAQFLGDAGDVHVLAACIDASQRGQRRGVLADESDVERFGAHGMSFAVRCCAGGKLHSPAAVRLTRAAAQVRCVREARFARMACLVVSSMRTREDLAESRTVIR